MRIAPLVSIAAICVVAGCSPGTAGRAGTEPTASRLVLDSSRIAKVESEARSRGVKVIWIHSPLYRQR